MLYNWSKKCIKPKFAHQLHSNRANKYWKSTIAILSRTVKILDLEVLDQSVTIKRKLGIRFEWCAIFGIMQLGWRHFVDNDISWTLFFKMGDFSRTLSKDDFSWTLFGDFLWTRSPLFGWIFMDIFWVNSSRHFLMVTKNSANRRGFGGEAPARLSKHCSLPG